MTRHEHSSKPVLSSDTTLPYAYWECSLWPRCQMGSILIFSFTYQKPEKYIFKYPMVQKQMLVKYRLVSRWANSKLRVIYCTMRRSLLLRNTMLICSWYRSRHSLRLQYDDVTGDICHRTTSLWEIYISVYIHHHKHVINHARHQQKSLCIPVS